MQSHKRKKVGASRGSSQRTFLEKYSDKLDPRLFVKYSRSELEKHSLRIGATRLQQIQRCLNPKHLSYKNYGSKNIKVEYNSVDFKIWYLNEFIKKDWLRPTVGRIDHDRGYSFDNIEMQEKSDNTKERIRRCGLVNPARPILVIDFKSNEPLMICKSTVEAAILTGCSHGNISNILRTAQFQSCTSWGKRLYQSHGFTFRYHKLD